jgi:Flp pilus assembly protein TadD
LAQDLNERVGHRFPGGTLDIQDTWLEVSVVDALGKRIAQAGTRQQSGRADPSAHVLRVLVIDGDGAPVRAHATHRFRTVAYDHSVAPRDADVVQVSFRVPQTLDKARLPLQAIARLRHRSRSLDMQQAACDAERSERGRRFAEATKAIGRHLDPCAAQPVFEIAATRAQLGGGRGLSSDTSPRWLRLYRHGLALLDVVGERVHEAAPSLRAALGDADIEDATQRSQIHVALARMLARQGRPEDAIEELTAASALTPDHPAIDRAHGEALLRVWRFDQAVMPLSRASDAAPLDDSGWVSLATALGSLGRGAEALGAVKRALIWQPRSEPLLRIQALVLGRVPVKESALDAYLEHREDDRASVFRRRCSEQSELCRLERVPIHTHSMR